MRAIVPIVSVILMITYCGQDSLAQKATNGSGTHDAAGQSQTENRQKPPERPQRNEKLIQQLDKERNTGYKALNLGPGDVAGAVEWCWNDRGTIGQDCGFNDAPWSFMSRHDIIAAGCKTAVATDCKIAGQITDVAAKCQCHNPGVAQDMRNHPAETCAAVRRYDPCF